MFHLIPRRGVWGNSGDLVSTSCMWEPKGMPQVPWVRFIPVSPSISLPYVSLQTQPIISPALSQGPRTLDQGKFYKAVVSIPFPKAVCPLKGSYGRKKGPVLARLAAGILRGIYGKT